jgi:hypothetical protein
MIKTTTLLKRWGFAALALGATLAGLPASASSHREAPFISQDPQADNTDLYAFRSPDDTNTITIIANYIPFQLPEGGPNYYTFGENVRYEIHIKNNTATTGDDITYRFAFNVTDQDPNTFFNVRLGLRNQRTTWTLTKIVSGGNPLGTVIANGVCPVPNIGPRSINGAIGLNQPSYDTLVKGAIATATSGEKVYCGPADDPFFVDLAGAFDLGGFRPQGNPTNAPKDGLARFNVSTIAIKVPITVLQKNNKTAAQSLHILDPDYVVGIWASASRQQVTTLGGGNAVGTGQYVQISRIGMPLTNEVIIPIAFKDRWNALTPVGDTLFDQYFRNPELALYMYGSAYGNAVPALNLLRIQEHSRPDLVPNGFDFRNGSSGLWPIKGTNLNGTAFDPLGFGNLLIPDNASPRAADILPIFLTGVPNMPPYQLATGKAGGNPLAIGKPFINNFLPTMGDMLRINMAVPVTPRNSAEFSSLGIIQAAVLGLTTAPYNTNNNMQWIPNMDGFPNGRRLEDDVTTIELQAVGGVMLAAIGLYYDDYIAGGSPLTKNLTRTLSFTAGPTKNDTTFKSAFPYVQEPWRGYDYSIQPRF